MMEELEDSKASWNDKLEVAVKEIGEQSQSYKFMHIMAARSAQNMYIILMMFGIILGPLAGALSGIGAALNPEADPTIPIISALLSSVSGIIIAIVKFGKYDEVSSSNKSTAAKYTSLETNVRRQLALYRQDRIDAAHYVEWLANSFDELFAAAPLLSSGIQAEYAEKAKSEGVFVPGSYTRMITINGAYEQEKMKEMTDHTVINIGFETSQSASSTPSTPAVHIPMQGSTRVERTNTLTPYPELNRFSDGEMAYELKRMMGFR
jgi:hypothetical protein